MLVAGQWNSARNAAPLSKRAMLDALAYRESSGAPPIARAKLAGRNTLDYTDVKGVRRIRLHKTDILTIAPSGAFAINTGGWNTHTTRDRLNEFLPAPWRVCTVRGVAHLRDITSNLAAIPFRETVAVSAKGVVKSDMKPKSEEKLRALVDAYMKAFRARGLPTIEESGGDPWILTQGKVDESTMLDWLKSKYVHRTLFALAHKWAGITDRGVEVWSRDIDRRGGELDRFHLGRIRRYIRACLGLG